MRKILATIFMFFSFYTLSALPAQAQWGNSWGCCLNYSWQSNNLNYGPMMFSQGYQPYGSQGFGGGYGNDYGGLSRYGNPVYGNGYGYGMGAGNFSNSYGNSYGYGGGRGNGFGLINLALAFGFGW